MSSLSSTTGSTTASNLLAGLNSSGIQFNGLASGLDTGKLIQGLLAIDQAKITQLTNNQQKIVQKQTAFKALEAQLLTIQTNSDRLSRTFSSVLDTRTVTSSSPDLVTASAASGAPTGVYSFHVDAVAQSAQIASQGFTSATSAITQGTIQFRVGTGVATTVTINGTNNTVQGLANAINDQSGDLTATVVNDGTTGQPFHILLASSKTGASNAYSCCITALVRGNYVYIVHVLRKRMEFFELVNTAIERVVKYLKAWHPLLGMANNVASSAVYLGFCWLIGVIVCLFWPRLHIFS